MSLGPSEILNTAVMLVVFIFSVIVHENAHGIVAEHFGDPTARSLGRITMNPLPHVDPFGSILVPIMAQLSGGFLFGWAKPVPVNSANLRNPVVHNAYVAAAGPASNFLLAFGSAVLYIIVQLFFKHVPGLREGGENTLLFFRTLCGGMITINVVLALFNLLPIPPLDGHWILMRYLPSRYAAALAAIRPYGFLILIALLMTGVLWMVIGPVYYFVTGSLMAFVRIAVAAL